MILEKNELNNSNCLIYQDIDKYHFNSDTTILGLFMRVETNESVLDIGCNNGALMLYASLYSQKEITGIDLFQEVIENAKINMKLNSVSASLVCEKVQNFVHTPFDVILCNPPYFASFNPKLINENKYISHARHEISLPMDELFSSVQRLLKENGRFYYVHRPSELNRIQSNLMQTTLRIKKIQFFYDKQSKKARTMCMEIVKRKNTQLLVEEPIYL